MAIVCKLKQNANSNSQYSNTKKLTSAKLQNDTTFFPNNFCDILLHIATPNQKLYNSTKFDCSTACNFVSKRVQPTWTFTSLA